MKQRDRTIAFLGAMLMAFGIATIDLETSTLADNTKEIIAIVAGLIFLVIFYINRYRDRKSKG